MTEVQREMESVVTDQSHCLDELGVRHNTDKASVFQSDKRGKRRPGHNYLKNYEFFLERYRRYPALRILELGAGPEWNCGASGRVWQDYFPNAEEIRLADIAEGARALEAEGLAVTVGDLRDTKVLNMLAKTSWDVIIDDASHQWRDQVAAFNCLFRALRPKGVYIIEDLHTSFGSQRNRFGASFLLGPPPHRAIDAARYFQQLALLKLGSGAGHPDDDPELEAEIRRQLDIDMISMITTIRGAVIVSRI